jgi:crossover junction endodeoxyribonuclease RuvC
LKILGIDQGIANMGYAMLEDENLIAYGYISTTNEDTVEQRFYKIFLRLEDIILEYEPEIICCEKLFYSSPSKGARNKSASIIYTNMITGVLACIAGKYNIELRMFVPSMIKKAICDDGTAKKDDVIAKINELYSIDTLKTKAEHVCDSIAIAYTCSKQNKEHPEIRDEYLKTLNEKEKNKQKKHERMNILEDKRAKKNKSKT